MIHWGGGDTIHVRDVTLMTPRVTRSVYTVEAQRTITGVPDPTDSKNAVTVGTCNSTCRRVYTTRHTGNDEGDVTNKGDVTTSPVSHLRGRVSGDNPLAISGRKMRTTGRSYLSVVQCGLENKGSLYSTNRLVSLK